MEDITFGDLYQPKLGPHGEVKLVRKGSREDPWISQRRDRCPWCLAQGVSKQGRKLDDFKFEGSGRNAPTYRCPICHRKWVWDKRVKYWTDKEIRQKRRTLRR